MAADTGDDAETMDDETAKGAHAAEACYDGDRWAGMALTIVMATTLAVLHDDAMMTLQEEGHRYGNRDETLEVRWVRCPRGEAEDVLTVGGREGGEPKGGRKMGHEEVKAPTKGDPLDGSQNLEVVQERCSSLSWTTDVPDWAQALPCYLAAVDFQPQLRPYQEARPHMILGILGFQC